MMKVISIEIYYIKNFLKTTSFFLSSVLKSQTVPMNFFICHFILGMHNINLIKIIKLF